MQSSFKVLTNMVINHFCDKFGNEIEGVKRIVVRDGNATPQCVEVILTNGTVYQFTVITK